MSKARERILVVDDKTEIIRFLVDLLQPLGYTVSSSTSGEEGLTKAAQEQPDLILLDLHMPGMSGLQVLEALNGHGYQVPVILMTLYGSEDVIVQALRLGARDYLTKPFQIPELLSAIEQALEKTRLQRERERLVRELGQTNKRLTRRMQELSVLQAVGRSVASLMPPKDLLRRIVDAALYLSDADAGILFLRDKASGQLRMEAMRQGDEVHSDLQPDLRDSHAQDVLRSGRPLWVPSPTKPTGATGYLGSQTRSLLYVPIKSGDQVAGVMGVAYLSGEEPSPQSQKRLMAVADYAAIALKNAQLFEGLQQRAEQLSTINRIAQMTASSLELKDVMRTVVEWIKESLQVETATLALLDEEKDELVFEVRLEADGETQKPSSLKRGQGIVGWVLQHRQALRADDTSQDPRFDSGVDEVAGFRTHSILCVPLIVSDRVIGAIEAINKLDDDMPGGRGLFTDQDEELLQDAAAFVAMAVENAHLHEAVRETATIQAIRQTMVTLSHYLNNSLQTLMGTSELLKPEVGASHVTTEAVRATAHEVQKIAAVLSVLRDIASPESTAYLGSTQMLDIEQELQARLASATEPYRT